MLALTFSMSAPASADDEHREPANYAFANYTGSGLYRASGQEVTVFNIPFSYQPKDQKSTTLIRWRLPVSIGFYNFDFDEVGNGNLPDEAGTISFTPGIEWEVPITETLTFVPYMDLGVGHNFTSDENVLIYSAGVSSHYQFGSNNQHLWVNRVLYAGYKGLSVEVKDGYATLQTGVDLRVPFDFSILGHESYITVYGLAQWHFINLEFIVPEQQSTVVENSFEVGMTLGAVKPLDFKLFNLERVGLGYRTGGGLKVWRVTFELPI